MPGSSMSAWVRHLIWVRGMGWRGARSRWDNGRAVVSRRKSIFLGVGYFVSSRSRALRELSDLEHPESSDM